MSDLRHRRVYTRWFALLVGLVTGAVVGFAVYWGSQLTGAALFMLCGTVAGGVAALVFYAYSRTMYLTELTVSIPNFTDLTFAVTPSNEGVAWRLFVESVTRVSTQPLTEGTGVVRETLNSLYSLFQSVRQTLVEAGPTAGVGGTQTVEHLAIGMLNAQMRPFLAKWHPQLLQWERVNPDVPESQWPGNAQCRAELEAMRLGLLDYVRGLGQLAGVRNIDVMLGRSADQ
ncbi:hypothetical protein [Micromonospora sp. DT231]|uniref:hypothetical protein n=1 Tax=Micromonospora sp. DT231 TaxID=3416526 RepID=UPI003CECACE0